MALLMAISLVLGALSIFYFFRYSDLGVMIAFDLFLMLCALVIYPLAVEAGAIPVSYIGEKHSSMGRDVSILTAIHVLTLFAGMVLGIFVFSRTGYRRMNAFIISIGQGLEYKKLWRLLIVFGVSVNLLFFSLVGMDNAFANSAALRSGNMDVLGDGGKWLFLKSLASLGLMACCMLPLAFNRDRDYKYIFLFFVLVVLAYLNTISRGVVLTFFILPILVTLSYSKDRLLMKVVGVMAVAALVYFVLLYGKSFGHLLSSAVTGGGRELVVSEISLRGFFEKLLHEQSYIFYSLDLGIENFLKNGPLFPMDVFISVFGFIPSGLFSFLNIQFLDYNTYQPFFSCYNSAGLALNDCTVPSRAAGYSGYLLPIGGGFLYGLFYSYIVLGLSRFWNISKASYPGMGWVPLFLYLNFELFLSFSPNTISRSAFSLLIIIMGMWLISSLKAKRVMSV